MSKGSVLSDSKKQFVIEELEKIRSELRVPGVDRVHDIDIARAIGVHQQNVARALKDRAIGPTVAEAVARHRGFDSLELMIHARSPNEDAPDPYPNRAKAKAIEQIYGELDPQDIASVDAMAGFKSEKDPPIDTWRGWMRANADARRHGVPRRSGTELVVGGVEVSAPEPSPRPSPKDSSPRRVKKRKRVGH